MDLQAPIPTVDSSVAMRDLSKYKALRVKSRRYYTATISLNWMLITNEFVKVLEQAFYFNMIITYSQGIHMLQEHQ